MSGVSGWSSLLVALGLPDSGASGWYPLSVISGFLDIGSFVSESIGVSLWCATYTLPVLVS